VFWYTDETRRLLDEHEVTKAETKRLVDWYEEVKVQSDAAWEDPVKAAYEVTLRILRRAIRSAQRRQNGASDAVYHSMKADRAAYVETPPGKAWDAVDGLMQRKRGQALQATRQSQLQREGQEAIRRARFDLLVKEQPLGRPKSTPDAASDASCSTLGTGLPLLEIAPAAHALRRGK
jgi:hypothetical protein